jgi:sensor histidine kinase regulating citrate/malate metabolism
MIKSSLERDSGIHVWIQDNGTGIRPESVGKIFDIGWTTKKGGMGFGLFWTKDYIEGLGGRINVETVWQEGTVFHICLPFLNGT